MYYNLRSKQKAVAAGTALAAVLLAWVPAAHAAGPNPEKCKIAIAKASAAWEQAKIKALGKCEAAKKKGKLSASQDCQTEAKAAAAITKAQGKLTDTLSKPCTGLTLTQIGWDGSGTPGNPVLDKTCSAGDRTGNQCERESECPGICVGGEKDTQSCSFTSSCANKVCVHAKCNGGSQTGNDCSSLALKAACVTGGGTCPFAETCSVSGTNLGLCNGGPTPNKQCAADSDCGVGGFCDNQCHTTNPGGFSNLLDCVSGYCNGGLCTTNKDCGLCTSGPLANTQCTANSDCGFTCSGGTNAGNSCKVAGDCPGGGSCTVAGVCSTGTCSGGFCNSGNPAHGRLSPGFCVAADRCPNFENNKLTFVKTCDGGANNGEACATDADCGGMVCDNNRNTHCTNNTPCGTGNCVSSCNQGCGFALSAPTDVANCVECLGEASVDQLNNLLYTKQQPTGLACVKGPNLGLPCQKLTADTDCGAGGKCGLAVDADKAVDKCKKSTAAAALKFFAAKRKALEKCEEAVLKASIPGPCSTDADTQAKITAAAGKLQAAIGKACGGADKAFGGGDDILPSSILAVFNCDDLTAPGASASCAGLTGRGPITTLQDLANCIQCITEFKVDCLDSLAAPANFATLPSSCNPLCGNGKLDGHCSVSTTKLCSSSLDCPGETCIPSETCDDSNPTTGDSCPGNCNIAACSQIATTHLAKIALAGPVGVDLGGIAVALHYPDGIVGIPGSGGAASVQAAVNAFTASYTANDLDYAIRVAATDSSPLDQTDVLEITFHSCNGAGVPAAPQFRCVVESASDLNGVPVAGVSCTVTVI